MVKNLTAVETFLRKFIGKVRRDFRSKEVDYRIVIQSDDVRLEMFNFDIRDWQTTGRFETLHELEAFLKSAGMTKKEKLDELSAKARQEIHDGEDDDT